LILKQSVFVSLQICQKIRNYLLYIIKTYSVSSIAYLVYTTKKYK